MDRLIDLHRQHQHRNLPPHVEAAWLHHCFTQIHPFQDGNGRVARAIATLVLIKQGLFPLVINRDDRERYIDALETADQGDMNPLTRLFAQVQKRALTKAIGKAADIRPVKTVEEALAATKDLLVDLGRITPKEYLQAQAFAQDLVNVTLGKVNGIVGTLRSGIGQVDATFQFSAGVLGGPPTNELRSVAEKLKYDPNVTAYHQAIEMMFKSGAATSRLIVSFHGVGAAFRGLIVAAAYFQMGTDTPTPLADDIFRINFQDSLEELRPRFDGWLESCLINGIAAWRQTLI